MLTDRNGISIANSETRHGVGPGAILHPPELLPHETAATAKHQPGSEIDV